MFYVKNCKNETLLMVNLQRECFFDMRNPAEPYFRAGVPIVSNMPLYIFSIRTPICKLLGKKSIKIKKSATFVKKTDKKETLLMVKLQRE